jgi:putative phosphoribosyl transferase
MRFRDREHAGQVLAARLERYKPERPIVLGLTRGGVPVAFQVARSLGVPLDVMVARKIAVPDSRGRAIGAIAEEGAVYANPVVLREEGLSKDAAAAAAEHEAVDLARLALFYRDGRPPPSLTDATVVLVSDGVATGASARAAARSARQRGAARVVLAAAVIPSTTERELRVEFEEVIAVEVVSEFFTLGDWYEVFEQVSDEAVLRYLHRARLELPAPGEGGELWNGEWIGPNTR